MVYPESLDLGKQTRLNRLLRYIQKNQGIDVDEECESACEEAQRFFEN